MIKNREINADNTLRINKSEYSELIIFEYFPNCVNLGSRNTVIKIVFIPLNIEERPSTVAL